MNECAHCGATDEPEHGVIVGVLGDRNENICTVCRTQDLKTTTVLSDLEGRDLDGLLGTDEVEVHMLGWETDRTYRDGAGTKVAVKLAVDAREDSDARRD